MSLFQKLLRFLKSVFFRKDTHYIESNKNFTEMDSLLMLDREFEKRFDELDPQVLLDYIREFRSSNLETISQERLSYFINRIIPKNFILRGELKSGAPLYRARRFFFDNVDESVFYKKRADIWYPKPEHLKYRGRLNEIGQPMLYTSFDARTPIYEIRSQPGGQFALIKYQVKENEKLVLAEILSNPSEYSEALQEYFTHYTKNGKRNLAIISQFIRDEFSKRVPDGKDYLYRVTIEIVKKFDFPGCDGFIYPSIEGGSSPNVVLKPAAADRALEFAGLAYVDNRSYSGGPMKTGDLGMWQRWAAFIDGNEIIYAPTSVCPLEFHGLNKPIASHTDYPTHRRPKP